MDIGRWSIISPLLDELLELEDDARELHLGVIASDDAALAGELRRWLAKEAERPEFLSEPLIDAAVFAPQPGQEIGPYRLEALIGEGGMGQVWRALRSDGLFQRRVALKLLRPGFGDAGLRARFTRERQILARLGHAHIARLLDAGLTQDGQPYLALDYVEGAPITDYADRLGLDVEARLALFLQVCEAVSHAHANLVVHRDLKPSNILVTPAGDVCLLDFGIAKLLDEPVGNDAAITRTGARTFTLHYAAPEQLRNQPVTTMTDVYALGVVLYELLVGRKPYQPARSSDAAWEEAILGEEPQAPSQALARLARDRGDIALRRRAPLLRGDLDNILLKALSKQPESRYPSVEALAQDLKRHIEGLPVQARAQSLGYRLRKYLRRHALGLSIVAVGGTLMATALAVVVWQADRALAQAARAQAMQDFVIALFEQADGAGSAQTIDVRALLDAGVRRADSELLGQPQSRAELLGLIARLRLGLGDDRAALELLQRQEPLLATLPESIALRIGLDAAALRGRALQVLGDYPGCVAVLGPWQVRSKALARPHPLPVAELLSQLGRCHHRMGELGIARDLFDTALLLRRSQAARQAEAESQTDLAMLQADAAQPEVALQAMQQALLLLRGHGGDRNALGVRVWQGLAALQRQLGDAQESESSYRQALEIALGRFGVAHPATAAVQQALGNLLLLRGKFGEAERLLQLARDQLARQFGAEHDYLWPLWRDLGTAQRELGRSEVAIASYSQALRLARRQADAETLSQLLCQLAAVHADVDELDRAEILAAECRRLAEGARSPAALHALRLQARIELQRGDVAAAAAWLGASEPLLRRHPGDADANALAVLRARIAMAQDDRTAVARQLAAVLPERASQPEHAWQWQALALQSALRCRSGDSVAGRDQRRLLLAALVQRQPERQHLLRELESLSDACAER